MSTEEGILSQPKRGKTWLALVFPSVLLFCLFATLYPVFPHSVYILMINYIVLFCFLLAVLRMDKLSLADIGWRVPSGSGLSLLIGEGIVLGLALRPVDLYVLSRAADHILGLFGVVLKPDSGGGATPLWAWIVVTTLFAGVVEESIFRGYGLSGFRLRMRPALAVVITSVLFGLFHFGLGLEDMVDSTMFGAILAVVFLWRRSVWPLAIAHAIVNALALTGRSW